MKICCCALLILIAPALGAIKPPVESGNASNDRVYGGYLIPLNSAQKQGFTSRLQYIQDGQIVTCSGSLVAQSWILSLASCLNHRDIGVRITGVKGELYESTIIQTILHPSYAATSTANNIGLGKVQQPFPSDGNFFPVALGQANWGKDAFLGKSLTVCGYRNPYTTLNRPTDEPTCSVFIPRSDKQCTDAGLAVRSNEVCVASTDVTKTSVCEQDFGAGLISYDTNTPPKFYIYAMATHGLPPPNDCARGPAAFLLLQGFIDWINENAQ
ncbi:trypsin II-P29-like [Lutzomyia longipalpis]|uniref:trypsin II-P29-like n=1 Tax=Lutzomyia longipalpis TaxID=7200 RepID=UPI002483DC29|nr:trypsin II-P29-like [Lutzomyia longipalpis]